MVSLQAKLLNKLSLSFATD